MIKKTADMQPPRNQDVQIKLTAKLDRPGGDRFCCGRCGADLHAVLLPEAPRSPMLIAGYVPRHHPNVGREVYTLTSHARKALITHGRPKHRRPIFVQEVGAIRQVGQPSIVVGAQAMHLPGGILIFRPALIECPHCSRLQWLSAEKVLTAEKR